MTHPDSKRAHRRHRRGTTLVLAAAALVGVLLVLAPEGSADASVASQQAVPTTWWGFPVGSLIWLAAGAAVLVLARLITMASRRSQRASLAHASGAMPTVNVSAEPGRVRTATEPSQPRFESAGVGAEALAYCA